MSRTRAIVVPPELASLLSDFDLEDTSDAFSLTTWEQVLSESDRALLRALLPSSETNGDEALGDLFSGAPLHFGAPLARFWDAMKAGEFSPDAVAAEAAADQAERQVRTAWQRQYHNRMVHSLLHLKRTYTPPTPTPPPVRSKASGSGNSESLVYSKEGGGLLRKRGVPGRKGGIDGSTPASRKRGGGGGSSKAGGARGAKAPKLEPDAGEPSPSQPAPAAPAQSPDPVVETVELLPTAEDDECVSWSRTGGAAAFGRLARFPSYLSHASGPHCLCGTRCSRACVIHGGVVPEWQMGGGS